MEVEPVIRRVCHSLQLLAADPPCDHRDPGGKRLRRAGGQGGGPPDFVQPGGKRHQVQPGRRLCPRAPLRQRQVGLHHCGGQRHRHPGGGSEPYFRAVLPGGQGPLPGRRRHGPGPCHRPGHGAPPGRQHRGALPPGRRDGLYHPYAAGQGGEGVETDGCFGAAAAVAAGGGPVLPAGGATGGGVPGLPPGRAGRRRRRRRAAGCGPGPGAAGGRRRRGPGHGHCGAAGGRRRRAGQPLPGGDAAAEPLHPGAAGLCGLQRPLRRPDRH